MQATDPVIDTLNGLLLGELAALETYERALSSARTPLARTLLRRVSQEHQRTARTLEEHIRYLGGQPESTLLLSLSGGEDEVHASHTGYRTLLLSLLECEQQGVLDYREALEEEALPPECQFLVRTSLLPQSQAHVVTLNALLE